MLSGRAVFLSIVFLAPVLLGAQAVTPERLTTWVEGISGQDPEGRRDFVIRSLKDLGVAFAEVPFDTSFTRRGHEMTVRGTNIVVRLGSGAGIVTVGAHYDAVPGSPGSNDNGAGVAVLLGLISTVLHDDPGVAMRFCFFDQEEVGLIGSAVYAREHVDSSTHLAMINLDVVGWGNEVFVGPVGEGDDDRIMPIVRTAAASKGIGIIEGDVYPSSDHRSFGRAGLENIAISIVPQGDTEKVTAMLRGMEMSKEMMPKVLTTMHTPQDGQDTIEPAAMMTAYELVLEILREAGKNR